MHGIGHLRTGRLTGEPTVLSEATRSALLPGAGGSGFLLLRPNARGSSPNFQQQLHRDATDTPCNSSPVSSA